MILRSPVFPSTPCRQRPPIVAIVALLAIGASCAACTPTVKVEAPDKPIEINLNVHIQQDVRVKLDRDLDTAFGDHPELFGPAAKARKPQESRP